MKILIPFLCCLSISTTLVATPSPDENPDAQPAKPMTMAEISKESLRGLSGVAVFLSDFNNNSANLLGLSMEQLRTDVELRLRQSGIKVYTQQEIMKVAGYPSLSVQLKSMPTIGANKFWSVDIHVRLAQSALLEAKPNFRMHLTTWDNSMTYYAMPRNEIAKKIRENVRDQVDKFCNDFLAVNSK